MTMNAVDIAQKYKAVLRQKTGETIEKGDSLWFTGAW